MGIIQKIRARLDKYEARGFDTQELRQNLNIEGYESKKRVSKKQVEELKRKSSSNFMRTKVEVKTDEGEWVKGLNAFKYIKAREEVKHLSTAEEIGIRLDNITENMPVITPADITRKSMPSLEDEDSSWIEEYYKQKAEKEAEENERKANSYMQDISKNINFADGNTHWQEQSIFYNLFSDLRQNLGDADFNDFITANEKEWQFITENFYLLSHYKQDAKDIYNGMVANLPEAMKNKLKGYTVRDEFIDDEEYIDEEEAITPLGQAWRDADYEKSHYI